MRRVTGILIAIALLTPAGLVAAQAPVFQGARDLTNEYTDAIDDPEADPNGLPPPTVNGVPQESLIFDAKARMRNGASGSSWINENFVGLVFVDGDGDRNKNFLLPGEVIVDAFYGNFTDIDNDQFIDWQSDAGDEWEGINANYVPDGMRAWVEPGYFPPADSDHYILGGIAFDVVFGAPDRSKVPDFDFRDLGTGGNWTSNFDIPTFDGSLITEITMASVANGLVSPTSPGGYGCGDDQPNCRIDFDTYTVVDETVSGLFVSTLDSAIATANDALNQTDPVVTVVNDTAGEQIDLVVTVVIDAINIADQAAVDVLEAAIAAFIPAGGDRWNETNPEVPYASMTTYDYTTGPHAWMNTQPWNSYSEPNTAALTVTPLFIPGTDLQGRGLSPHTIGIQIDTRVWYDENADYVIDDGEFSGSCDTFNVTTGARTILTTKVEAVDDEGNPVPWGPTGVYVFKDENPNNPPNITVPATPVTREIAGFGINMWDEVVLDFTDLRVDRLVAEGPIYIESRCDNADPGDWFANEVMFFPMGTFDFNLKYTTLAVDLQFRNELNAQVKESVSDTDFFGAWMTSEELGA